MLVLCGLLPTGYMNASIPNPLKDASRVEPRISALLSQMTLAEKIGQMSQKNAGSGYALNFVFVPATSVD